MALAREGVGGGQYPSRPSRQARRPKTFRFALPPLAFAVLGDDLLRDGPAGGALFHGGPLQVLMGPLLV